MSKAFKRWTWKIITIGSLTWVVLFLFLSEIIRRKTFSLRYTLTIVFLSAIRESILSNNPLTFYELLFRRLHWMTLYSSLFLLSRCYYGVDDCRILTKYFVLHFASWSMFTDSSVSDCFLFFSWFFIFRSSDDESILPSIKLIDQLHSYTDDWIYVLSKIYHTV